MPATPRDELLAGYLEGTLSEAACRELAHQLTASAALRDELARHQVLDALLQQVAEPALDAAAVIRALPEIGPSRLAATVAQAVSKGAARPRRAARWLALAAGLALAIAGGLWLYPRLADAPALGLRLAASQGAVTVTRAGRTVPVSQGLALHDGDQVAAKEGSKAALKYDGEETKIELRSATATFGTEKSAKRVKLAAGTLVCTVAPQKLPLEIQTPQAVARVVGTRFTLAADAAATRLAVVAGLVRLTRTKNNAAVDVPAGNEAAVSNEADPRVKPTRARGLLLDLDFEDRILPEGSSGTVVTRPYAANSRFCVAGAWVKDERLFMVRIRNGGQALLTYREGAVLSFDYWVKKQTGALDVYFWNRTRAVSPGANVWAPAQEQWTPVTLRLADFNKESRDGDLITELVIQTTPGGNELFVDNIRIETEAKP